MYTKNFYGNQDREEFEKDRTDMLLNAKENKPYFRGKILSLAFYARNQNEINCYVNFTFDQSSDRKVLVPDSKENEKITGLK